MKYKELLDIQYTHFGTAKDLAYNDIDTAMNQALIALVGAGIRNVRGTAARVFSCIRNININMISQGSSQTNLSFLIDQENLEEAIRVLHREMIEIKGESVSGEHICA